jgi:hypothetical protein
MSAKQLTRLAAVLVVLVVAWGVLALVRRPASDQTETVALAKVDTASVDSVVLSTAHGSTSLVRGHDKRWRANGYPADSALVESLLKGLADTARTSELVAVEKSSFGRFGLGPDSAQRVVAYSHGRPAFDVTAGKRTSDYAGIYLRRGDQTDVFAVRGQLAEPLAHSAGDDWKDKRVVSIVPDSAATIEVTRGGSSYSVRQSGKRWALASGKPTDSSAVASLLGNYRDLQAAGFATTAQADSLDFKRPRGHTRLLSKSGAVLANLVFDSTAAGTWARADSGGAVFRLDPWIWGRLAPAESTLVVKKPPTPATKKPTKK